MTATAPDPRLNAFRADLAAESLRGRVKAQRYAAGERRQVGAASAPLRREPRFDAGLDTEALCGEYVTVYDEAEGWAWAQLERDGYVGYIPADALDAPAGPPTHRVNALMTHVYPSPDVKAPPLDLLCMNAAFMAERKEGKFLLLGNGGFVFAGHAAALDEPAADFVAVAERFAGAPYLWGGRTALGLDCSALVQLALEAAGQVCPRDTDMQEKALGGALPEPLDRSALRRGDLVFWKGHVGIMTDGKTLLHANAHHMAAAAEPLEEAAARIAAGGAEVTSVRRLAGRKTS